MLIWFIDYIKIWLNYEIYWYCLIIIYGKYNFIYKIMLFKDIFECWYIYYDKGDDIFIDVFKCVKNNLYKFVEKNIIYGIV